MPSRREDTPRGESTTKDVLTNHCEVENLVILNGLSNSAMDYIRQKARNLGMTAVC